METKKYPEKYKGPFLYMLVFTSLLLAFLLLTKPSDENFGFSLIPLFLLWFVVYFTMDLIFKYLTNKSVVNNYRVVSITAASTVVLVIMFSALGQLQVFDVLLLVTLMALSVFYISRTWRK